MNRTAFMQEVLQMRFEEARGGWHSGRLTQEEVARILGVSERTFRWQLAWYEEGGLSGLCDKRLGQVSHRRAPVDELMNHKRSERIYQEERQFLRTKRRKRKMPAPPHRSKCWLKCWLKCWNEHPRSRRKKLPHKRRA